MSDNNLTYATVCSGIEAPSVAWETLGWRPLWFSEIEPFPCAVLDHHYPNTPNLGNMEDIDANRTTRPDIIIGGTPCQSFSVAGLRKGLDDPRGNLALEYLRLVDQFRPTWFVWENVPGVLSSNGGRDFGAFLGAVAKLGYHAAYRVLDAQYFGVAQRRRRVFVVGHIRDWRRAAAVLFDSESLRGNPAPSRETGQGVATDLAPCIGATCMATGQAGAEITDGYAPTLNCNHEAPIAFERRMVRTTGGQPQENLCHCLRSEAASGDGAPCVAFASIATSIAVRRLTPVECERLQGFPDNYTRIPWRNKPAEQCSDGPRYKALGNSMAVPVIKWIGDRIEDIETSGD